MTCLSTDVTNTYLQVQINPNNVLVECTFFQPGYTCTIDYGTDPSYTNLVYRDSSPTLGRQATITLSRSLSEDTTYYYIVSVVPSESSFLRVRVQGRFRLSKFAYTHILFKKKHWTSVIQYFLSVEFPYSPYSYGFMITFAQVRGGYLEC